MAEMDRSPAHYSSGPRVPIRPISGEETANIGRPPDKAKRPVQRPIPAGPINYGKI